MTATENPPTVLTGAEAAQRLRLLGACEDAREWVALQPDWPAAWAACERGEWMLWLVGRRSGERTSPARRLLVKAACECARLALPHIKAGETRPLAAIELAERWANGDDTISQDDLRQAADAAWRAAWRAAAAAADAAADAADAADAAADAADAAAADAADAAADADAARSKVLAECAAIVRRHYPTAPTI